MTELELRDMVQAAGGYLEGRLPDHRHCNITHGEQHSLWLVTIYSLDKPDPDVSWSASSLPTLIARGKEQYASDITTPTRRQMATATRLSGRPGSGLLVFAIEHPGGQQTFEARSLAGIEAAATEIAVWRLAFEPGEYEEALGADYDARTTFVAGTVDLIVPAEHETDRLQLLILLEERFFTQALDLASSQRSASAAGLVRRLARQHIEELYRCNWLEITARAKRLRASRLMAGGGS
jgi:hypothetical protein